ncbi:uncharacterized protein LOC131249620 [Magnolia sinica]|uniref:uncharacterized protein LOC131249620 n=1 Tax=Magnolia sinica TaxID=86752 RepID=UPI002658F7E4|nr:uncharacterized protein LOC131249620 [Magnolia sinica]
MKIVSWNVRGVGSKHKRSLIKATISTRNPDVVCFQETKVATFKNSLLASLWGVADAKWFALDADGSSRGILIAWKSSSWDLLDSSRGNYSGSVKLKDKCSSFQCLISVVYGPNSDSDRPSFWEELTLARLSFAGPYCVVGDFNATCSADDHSRRRRPPPAMSQFSDWIQLHQLIDLPLSGARYTSGRANPVLSRLDRFLISLDWFDAFPNVQQIALPRTTSDHCPIFLSVEENWGPKPFKFNSSWLQSEALRQNIKE